MVSIAESFNYRIFERKWRTGVGFRGSSLCMPFLSVEQTTNGEGIHFMCSFFLRQKAREPGAQARRSEIILSVRPFDPVIAALPNDREVAAAQ